MPVYLRVALAALAVLFFTDTYFYSVLIVFLGRYLTNDGRSAAEISLAYSFFSFSDLAATVVLLALQALPAIRGIKNPRQLQLIMGPFFIGVLATILPVVLPRDYAMLLTSRGIQGAMSALYNTYTLSQLVVWFPTAHHPQALAFFSAGHTVGDGLAPIIGGVLESFMGIRSAYISSLIMGAVTFALMGAVVLLARWEKDELGTGQDALEVAGDVPADPVGPTLSWVPRLHSAPITLGITIGSQALLSSRVIGSETHHQSSHLCQQSTIRQMINPSFRESSFCDKPSTSPRSSISSNNRGHSRSSAIANGTELQDGRGHSNANLANREDTERQRIRTIAASPLSHLHLRVNSQSLPRPPMIEENLFEEGLEHDLRGPPSPTPMASLFLLVVKDVDIALQCTIGGYAQVIRTAIDALLPLVMIDTPTWQVSLVFGGEVVGSVVSPFVVDWILSRWPYVNTHILMLYAAGIAAVAAALMMVWRTLVPVALVFMLLFGFGHAAVQTLTYLHVSQLGAEYGLEEASGVVMTLYNVYFTVGYTVGAFVAFAPRIDDWTGQRVTAGVLGVVLLGVTVLPLMRHRRRRGSGS